MQGGVRMQSLAIIRKNFGLTQENVAKMLGVANSTYAQYESGARSPNIVMLKKLADLFQCTIDELVGR